ncbi:hypothetical protein M0R45_001146 [Rubus argutus]|uniref:Uncharacterized protein n=1 Tax=Rubus argutus TaxID=59490 RepID=A0AAW1VJY8_RUBAR
MVAAAEGSGRGRGAAGGLVRRAAGSSNCSGVEEAVSSSTTLHLGSTAVAERLTAPSSSRTLGTAEAATFVRLD